MDTNELSESCVSNTVQLRQQPKNFLVSKQQVGRISVPYFIQGKADVVKFKFEFCHPIHSPLLQNQQSPHCNHNTKKVGNID